MVILKNRYQKPETLKLGKVRLVVSTGHSISVCPPTYNKYCLRDWLVCCKIDMIQVAKGIS